MTEEEARQVWKEARTFENLCSLMAEYIQRKIPRSPTYLGEPNDETDRIQSYLVRLNHMGFLTLQSQPAEALAEGCAQRADVEGFAQKHPWARTCRSPTCCRPCRSCTRHRAEPPHAANRAGWWSQPVRAHGRPRHRKPDEQSWPIRRYQRIRGRLRSYATSLPARGDGL